MIRGLLNALVGTLKVRHASFCRCDSAKLASRKLSPFLFIPVKYTFHHINQSNNHSLKILIMLLV